MNANRRNAVLAAAVLAVQCLAIGWLIWRYESIVRFGTEVRFRCEAYDPYDPLRGRYLRTTVRERCDAYTGFPEEKDPDIYAYRTYGRMYAKLEPSTNGLWRVSAVADAPKDDGGLWINPTWARIEHSVSWGDQKDGESSNDFSKRRRESPYVAVVSLPDQLFVNERLAPAAEKVLREATSDSGKEAVAVYRVKDGEIVITDIEIGGRPILELAREGSGGKQ